MSQTPLPPDFMPWEPDQTPAPPPAKRRAGVITLALTLVIVLSVMVLLRESVLMVRPSKVAVVGNSLISWEEVVKAAGLDQPVSYFSLNEEKIAAGINSHRYLIFDHMEKEFPDRVTLYVRERQVKAHLEVSGRYYQIDGEGMVLEYAGTEYPNDDRINITGLQPKGSVSPGGMITSSRLTAYTKLMTEIDLQGISQRVSELNFSELDNITLVTVDGYTVYLGDDTDLRAKIGTMRAVLAELDAMVERGELSRRGGLLEASVPGEAVYTPPTAANPD